jgi:hypothetical protein
MRRAGRWAGAIEPSAGAADRVVFRAEAGLRLVCRCSK